MTLETIATYLEGHGLTPIGRNYLPPSPATAHALYETGGAPSTHVMGSTGPGRAVLEQPTLQLLTRGATETVARTNAQRAFKLLDGLKNYVGADGVRYLWVTANQTPFLIEVDENRRWVYSCNFTIRQEAST